MKQKFITILLLLTFCFFHTILNADTLILKSGSKITGKITKESDTHYTVFTDDLGEISIEKEKIEEIIKDNEKAVSLSSISLDNLVDKLLNAAKTAEIKKSNPAIAIFPFQVDDPSLRDRKIGSGISEVMTDIIVSKWIKDFSIIERSKLEEILSEQKLGLSGALNENAAIKTGQLLSADLLLLGSVSGIGGNYYINARLVKSDTGKIVSAESISQPVKEINREAKSYINLPDNWAAYYGFKTFTLTAEYWQDVPNVQPAAKKYTNTEYKNRSVAFFIIGFRHFFDKHILADFQFSPNPVTSAEHTIQVTNAGVPENHIFEIHGGLPFSALTLSWVQKFGNFYGIFGGGLNILKMELGEGENKGNANQMFLSGRFGIEWRFKKRVGIDIIADRMLGDLKMRGSLTDFTPEKPFLEINPLVTVMSINFYF